MNQQTEPSISIKNVTRKYHFAGSSTVEKVASAIGLKKSSSRQTRLTKTAVNDVSVEIETGERLGIVGKNGAGKSTLLHMIAGLSEPTSGSILVNGKVTSIMTLGLGLREDLTGRQNIYVDGEIQGKTKSEIDRFIDEIIEFAELAEFIDYPVRTYSTGMKSRLAFAMITCITPEILIIDEALSAGDAAFSVKAAKKIQEICNAGKIVILVSHGMQTINQICNRCLWMENGKLIADGPPDVITKQYIEAIRAQDEKDLQEKFRSLVATRTNLPGNAIATLDLRTGSGEGSRFIFDSGEDLIVRASILISQKYSNLKVGLKISRIDGLILIDECQTINLHGHHQHEDQHANFDASLEIYFEKFPLGQGVYQLELSSRIEESILAERTVVFEVTSTQQPRGGRPALLYPSRIQLQEDLKKESNL